MLLKKWKLIAKKHKEAEELKQGKKRSQKEKLPTEFPYIPKGEKYLTGDAGRDQMRKALIKIMQTPPISK
jgi:hypothetical protein